MFGYRNVRFGDGYVGRYADKTYSIDSSKRDEIEKRMANLYGEDWQLSTKELAAKLNAEYSVNSK